MKWASPEYKRIRLTSIRCDVADIRRRMKEPHVVELAADIAARGDAPIHAPTIRVDTGALVCGRDRMAALMVNKAKSAWVHRGEFTEAEAAEMEEAENIYRRHDTGERAAALARLVALREQAIRAEETAARGDSVPGSKSAQTVKAEARKDVARRAGITPASVKKAEQRAAAKDATSPAGPLPGGSKPAPAGVAEPAPNETSEWLDEWAHRINDILREVSEMDRHRALYGVSEEQLQRIREPLQAAGRAVRETIPAQVEAAKAEAPKPPKKGKSIRVVMDGREVPIDDFPDVL